MSLYIQSGILLSFKNKERQPSMTIWMTWKDITLSRITRHRGEITEELSYPCDPNKPGLQKRSMLIRAKTENWECFLSNGISL